MSDVALDSLVIDNTEDGVFRVNRSVFTDPHILALEQQRVFEHSWIYAGHESELPQPGDFRWEERLRTGSLLQLAIRPQDLASAYVFLASRENARAMTGVIVHVDAGSSLRTSRRS
jgi:hypothetical protein